MSRAYCDTAGHTWREGTAECMMCGAVSQCYACDATATGSRTLVEGEPPTQRKARACKRHSDGGDPKRRREVGAQRIIAAQMHIATARAHLDAACRDICSVNGLGGEYREISRLVRELLQVRNALDEKRYSPDAPPVELDHEPSDLEHGSVHACGGLHCEGYAGETVPG